MTSNNKRELLSRSQSSNFIRLEWLQKLSSAVRKLLNRIRPYGGTYDPLHEKITEEDEGIDDLPGSISPCDDEGRAIGQVIHDVAPRASLLFSSTSGKADMVAAIHKMSNNGRRASTTAGITGVAAAGADVTSAGNDGRQSYESSYRSSEIAGE
jgi:hypothetical protein